jgi:hypothetical protein
MTLPNKKKRILEMKLRNLIKKFLREESPWKYKEEDVIQLILYSEISIN